MRILTERYLRLPEFGKKSSDKDVTFGWRNLKVEKSDGERAIR